MQPKVTTQVIEKEKPKIYFCWNNKEHPFNYSEVRFEGNYKPNEMVKCPVCGQVHKITQRL